MKSGERAKLLMKAAIKRLKSSWRYRQKEKMEEVDK